MKCFSGKIDRREILTPVQPDLLPPIALVVGHNENNQGAVNYLGESEYIFNKRIGRKVQIQLAKKGIKNFLFTRPVGSYSKQCKNIAKDIVDCGAVLSVHLHFNSSEQKARGLEVLCLPSILEEDKEVAEMFAGVLSNMLDIKKRHQSGVVELLDNHRGKSMLELIRDTSQAIPILVEPCFANYRNPDSTTIFEREDDYAYVLSYCIDKFMNRYRK